MKTSIIIGIVVVVIVVIIGGIILAVNIKGSSPSHGNTGNQQTPPAVPSTGGNTSGTGAQTYNVAINNFAFSPPSLSVKVGDTVVWINNQAGVPHTVTSDTGSELSSISLSTGGMYSQTFSTAGTFNYHCSIHTMMKATVIVS